MLGFFRRIASERRRAVNSGLLRRGIGRRHRGGDKRMFKRNPWRRVASVAASLPVLAPRRRRRRVAAQLARKAASKERRLPNVAEGVGDSIMARRGGSFPRCALREKQRIRLQAAGVNNGMLSVTAAAAYPARNRLRLLRRRCKNHRRDDGAAVYLFCRCRVAFLLYCRWRRNISSLSRTAHGNGVAAASAA